MENVIEDLDRLDYKRIKRPMFPLDDFENKPDLSAKLIEISKGKVCAFLFVINLFDLGGLDKLMKKRYHVESLINFPGH